MTACFFAQDQLRGSSGLVDGWGDSTEPSAKCCDDAELLTPSLLSICPCSTSAASLVFSLSAAILAIRHTGHVMKIC